MTTRKYSSRSQQTALSAALTSTATTATVISGSNLMGGATLSAGETFTVVIDPDTALEEIVDVTAVSTNTLTITRGVENAGTGQAHSAGAVVRHMVTGRDLREANTHIENTSSAHGLTIANVVSTTDTSKVSSGMIVDGAVGTAKIDNAAVTEAKIGTSAVTTTKIADLNVTTGKIADSAITSAKIADGTIVNADINSAAAIDKTKISGTAITAGDTGTVTSTMIADGTIVNADINSSAQIAYGKLNLTNGIVDGDISASAAITATKVAGTAVTQADTGTVTSTMIANGTIVNADINASAAIDWTKIAPSSTVSATELGYLDGVTSAVQTQLDAKLGTSTAASTYAPIASPTFTGVPAAPTATAGTNTTQIATTAFVKTAVDNVIAAAPGALDTLNELAAALGNDASFSTTVTNNLATKLPLAGGTMTGAIAMSSNKITGLGTPTSSTDAATKAYADTMLPLAGGTMSGAIAMGTNKITGMGNPTLAQDAATKYYVDNVTVAPSNLTGPITSVGAATSIASQTGTGTKFVMDTSPTLVTPNIGVATATSINGTTIPTSKTLVATDSTAYVVPSQTGNSGKALTTDGTTSSWSTTINGTAIPSSKTLVTTDTTAYVSTAGGSTVTASGATVVPVVLKGAASQTGDLTQWQNSAGTVLARVDASGNVGIGTTSPSEPLRVQSSGTSTTAGGNVVARFQSNGSGYDTSLLLSDNVSNSITISQLSGATIFRRNGVESMRIDANGSVGIGASSPSSANKLFVSGADSSILAIVAGTTKAVRLGTTSTTAFIEGVDNTGSASYQPIAIGGATVQLLVSGTERMRIDSAGATTVTNTTTTGGAVRNIYMSTSAPSGGSDGDVWIQYA